jgi:MFS family permease
MFQNIYRHYIEPMRTFNRDARLFLWMTIINGVIISGWQLFFNIYMLQNGFGRDFLGLINSLPSITGLIFGIPLGRLSDRIGHKSALVVSIIGSGLALLGQITFHGQIILAVMAGLNGIFNMLLFVSLSPLMMKLSDGSNRTLLFSLNFGLQTLAGSVGSLFAGQLPGLFGNLLHVGETSAIAYRSVLAVTILLGMTALIPLWMMREPKTAQTDGEVATGQPGFGSSLMRLIFKLATPNFLTGLGAAILIPYMNVFFKDRFSISDLLLGVLFGMVELSIGIGSILGPRLAQQLGGKIRAVVVTHTLAVAFLLAVGFSPSLWIAGIAAVIRAALANMSAPLYSAFTMEQTPERHHGFVSSVMNISWQIGWAIGPYLSGLVQVRYGFAPLFIATSAIYLISNLVTWILFRDSENVSSTAEPAIV